MTDDLKQRLAGLSPERLELFLRLSRAAQEPSGGEIIPPRADPSQAPLSALQRRLWFLDQLDGGQALYNMYAVFDLRGALDCRALAASFREMARRHEILRTRFEVSGGEPVQIIETAPAIVLPVVDLGALPDKAERRRLGDEAVRAEIGRPFDLGRDPLLRVLLVDLGADERLLAVTFHHIIADGASIVIFIREITALYAALSQGRPSPLGALPIQYADYAAWEQRKLDEETLARQSAWWRETLHGAPPLLELPADRPRPAQRSARGGAVEVSLPGALTTSLRRLAGAESSTLYMALLAAFQAFLARLSGQGDILVGSPAAGRDQVGIEGIIGPFVKTLVRRARFSDNPSFRRLLSRIRRDAIAAEAHADLPFDKLVEALRPQRNPGYTPLFQVWLVLHTAPMPTIEVPRLALSPVAAHNGTAKFDLTLEVAELEGRLRGFFEYSSDLFDTATVERWALHLETFIGRIVADADAPLSSVSLLSDGEIRQILREWGTEAAAPEEAADFLAAPASAAAVALRAGEVELSYRELAEQSRRLARHLRGRGVGPEVPVGLCVERGPEMIVGLFAILGAGGTCVPLDPKYPAERLARIFEEVGIGLLVTQQTLLFELPEAAMTCDLFCFETDLAGLDAESPEPLGESFPEENLAYVIFTSGSTGVPKGVAVSRGALTRHLGSARKVFGLSPEDRVLQFASLSFDVAFEQILSALGAGATLVLRGEEMWSTRELDRQIRQGELSVVNLPTGFWQQWLGESDDGAAALPRLLIAGGDTMSPAAVDHWRGLPGRGRLLNAYGPTEAVITASVWEVSAGERSPAPGVAIGRPLPGRRLYILDREARPVPPGVAGELCLGDPLLARGYLGRPGSTAERFVPDPFSAAAGSRLYRSGDLARWRPDRNVEHLGRIDRQVKVRGFRIELGEIEEALSRHDGVGAAAVVVRGTASEEKRIVAYVVAADPGAAPSAESLRAALGERLPAYMLPSLFVFLPELPLTENGKLDRRALPEPKEENAAPAGTGQTGEAEPAIGEGTSRASFEAAVAEIWAEVLELSAVELDDDFFDLGGHSLLGTLVISEVLDRFGVELPLDVLFTHPTVAAFAAAVEAAGAAAPEEPQAQAPPPIAAVSRQGRLPLSFAQQRLWFLETVEPGTPVYHLPAAVHLRGPLDAAALRAAIHEVVARHEMLRTTFAVMEDEPVQVIAPELALPLPSADLAALPPAAREAKLRAEAAAEARRPFDLGRGPLLRFRLLRTGEEEHTLLLTLHHIVADGWSLGILLREVAELYPALAAGESPSLAPLPVQYADFAHWQRQWLVGEELRRQLDYWREQLGNEVPALELPFAGPRPERPSHQGTFRRFDLTPDCARGLRKLSRHEDATLFMTLMAAFQVLLYRLSGQEEFTVGTGIANRNHPGTEALIGFFVNTLVLRADLRGNPDFRELLGRVRASALGAYAHQDLPFEKLVEELRPGRELARSPLFQVMFLFQNTPMPVLRVGELDLVPLRLDTGTSHFDLTLEMQEEGEGIFGVVEYSTEIFDASSIEALIDLYVALLDEVVRTPDLPILELPIQPPAAVAGPAATLSLDDSFVFEAEDG